MEQNGSCENEWQKTGAEMEAPFRRMAVLWNRNVYFLMTPSVYGFGQEKIANLELNAL